MYSAVYLFIILYCNIIIIYEYYYYVYNRYYYCILFLFNCCRYNRYLFIPMHNIIIIDIINDILLR